MCSKIIKCRLWAILASVLGIAKNQEETKILSGILYFLTFSSATSKTVVSDCKIYAKVHFSHILPECPVLCL